MCSQVGDDRRLKERGSAYITVPRKTRRFKKADGNVGVIWVLSPRDSRNQVHKTRPMAEIPEAVSKPIVTEELHETMAEPASCRPTIKRTVAAVSNNKPRKSRWAKEDLCRDRARFATDVGQARRTRRMVAAPIGTLSQKSQRQVVWLHITPPTTGPSTEDTAKTAPVAPLIVYGAVSKTIVEHFWLFHTAKCSFGVIDGITTTCMSSRLLGLELGVIPTQIRH